MSHGPKFGLDYIIIHVHIYIYIYIYSIVEYDIEINPHKITVDVHGNQTI